MISVAEFAQALQVGRTNGGGPEWHRSSSRKKRVLRLAGTQRFGEDHVDALHRGTGETRCGEYCSRRQNRLFCQSAN